ncbi:MAG: hypothetical protein EZS28_030017, partial [Streblomastix strix]
PDVELYFATNTKTSDFQAPRNFRDVLNDDTDKYSQLDDEYMESKGCEVYVDERSGEVTMRFRGEVKVVVKENGLYAPDTGEILQCGFFEFEDDEELGLWSAYVLADAAELKQEQLQSLIQSQSQNVTFMSQKQPAKCITPQNNMISAKYKQDGSIPLQSQSLNPLQVQFQQQRQQYSKFYSLYDQKVAQDLVSSIQYMLKKDASKIDMLNYKPEPFTRQKLFDEISWKGANVIFPMPVVELLLLEEKAGYAWRALESSAAVVQGMAGLIHKVAQGETDNLVGKMFKVFEAAVVSVSDAQVERESRLEGVFQDPQTEDDLSLKTQERIKRKSAKQVIDGRRDSVTPNQHHFTVKSNPSFRLKIIDIHVQQNSTQKPTSSKLDQQIEAVRQEHVSFDPAKDVERAGCGDQGSIDLATNLDGLAEFGDQRSTENRMKLKVQDNRTPRKQQHNLEQLIQESLYTPEADQLTDQETISRISKHLASAHQFGFLIDHSQSNTCITYHPGEENEIQDTKIKSLLQEHQHPANIPTGGRLTHFVDAWKLIGVDALVTRGIKAFWINIQTPQIQEINMTNTVKIRSKDSQLALGKLIDKELQENIIEEVPFSQLKWINPCFAIPKGEPGKWRKIMNYLYYNLKIG